MPKPDRLMFHPTIVRISQKFPASQVKDAKAAGWRLTPARADRNSRATWPRPAGKSQEHGR